MYKEDFISAFRPHSYEEALKILESIRESHPASSGWKEISFCILPLSDGRYEIHRLHQKD